LAVGGGTNIIGASLTAMAFAFAAPSARAAAVAAPAVQIAIGGGTVDSAAFRWSSALSEILSRPPGLPDCDPSAPCGVPGVIATARTYDDSASLLKALADRRVATAVVPALPVFRARCLQSGLVRAPFAVLKNLYRQPLYIVVPGGLPAIAQPKGWTGKTLTVGVAGSDSALIASALLEAYGVPRDRVKTLRLPPAQALAAMRSRTAAVGIFIGRTYDAPVADLVRHGFTLVSLPDSPERKRLLKAVPVLEAAAIPPGAFPGLPPTSTVSQTVSWVAGPGLDSAIAEKLVAAIAEPHNLTRLEELVDPVPPVPEGEAFLGAPAPLADAAKHFAGMNHLPTGTIDCPTPSR